MKIRFNHTEIEEALVTYIEKQGVDLSGKIVEIELTGGRSGNGHYADMDITPADAPAAFDHEANKEAATVKEVEETPVVSSPVFG